MSGDDGKKLRFIESHHVALAAGEYDISLEQAVSVAGDDKAPFEASRKIAVFGERFSLKDSDVFAVFPPHGSQGDHSNVVPHLTLTRSTLPWERHADHAHPKVGWLALLVFHGLEAPKVQNVKLKDLSGTGMPTPKLEDIWQHPDDPVSIIDVPLDLFTDIAPSFDDLSYLTHARQTTEASGEVFDPEYATVIANRLPQPGGITSVHLVSLEGRFKDGKFVHKTREPVRLVTLKNWSFECPPLGHDFAGIAKAINVSGGDAAGSFAPIGVQLPADPADSALVAQRKAEGYVLLPHDRTNGSRTVSWYRGPLIGRKHPDEPMHVDSVLEADDLYAQDPDTGLVDVSYATAWQLGRLMAMRDSAFSMRLYNWKRRYAHAQNTVHSGEVFTALFPDRHDNPNTLDRDEIIHDWFLRLAALEDVPFNYLVPDDAMLPQEALRTFHLDWMWVEYLLDGAFSIGRVMDTDKNADDDHKSEGRIPKHRDLMGVLIRSELVSGWPGLKVTGGNGAKVIKPLRFERLAPDVLIVLLENHIDHIDLHLAPESLHFGFVRADSNYATDLRVGGKISGQTIDVNWRDFGERTVNVAKFADDLRLGLNMSKGDFSAADFALQMINGAPSIRFKIN